MTTRLITLVDIPMPSRIGGPPHLPQEMDWPVDAATGEPMTFLFQVEESFLRAADSPITLPGGSLVSVFMLLRDQNGYDTPIVERTSAPDASFDLRTIATRVIVHLPGEPRRRPPNKLRNLQIGGMLPSEPVDDPPAHWSPDRSALVTSKVGGLPSWCQDPIMVPGHVFALQLNYRAFAMAGPARFGNVLFGGIGYLFLEAEPRLGDAGFFFLQFT